MKLSSFAFKDSAPAAQSTHGFSVVKTNELMLYRKMNAVCSEMRTKHINIFCGQNADLINVKSGGAY
jgi:hypothetical protein